MKRNRHQQYAKSRTDSNRRRRRDGAGAGVGARAGSGSPSDAIGRQSLDQSPSSAYLQQHGRASLQYTQQQQVQSGHTPQTNILQDATATRPLHRRSQGSSRTPHSLPSSQGTHSLPQMLAPLRRLQSHRPASSAESQSRHQSSSQSQPQHSRSRQRDSATSHDHPMSQIQQASTQDYQSRSSSHNRNQPQGQVSQAQHSQWDQQTRDSRPSRGGDGHGTQEHGTYDIQQQQQNHNTEHNDSSDGVSQSHTSGTSCSEGSITDVSQFGYRDSAGNLVYLCALCMQFTTTDLRILQQHLQGTAHQARESTVRNLMRRVYGRLHRLV